MDRDKAVILRDWLLLDRGIHLPVNRAEAIIETVAPHIAALDSLLEHLPPEAEIASFQTALMRLRPKR